MENQISVLQADKEVLLQGLQLLLKLFENLIMNPTQDKFKNIKPSNQTLKTKLFNVKNMDVFLQQVGFQLVDQDFVYQSQDLKNIVQQIQYIKQKIQEINDSYLSSQDLIRTQNVRKQQELYHQQELEAQKLKQSYLDKAKQNQNENSKKKAQDSVSNKLNFGAQQSGFKECGVNVNKGG